MVRCVIYIGVDLRWQASKRQWIEAKKGFVEQRVDHSCWSHATHVTQNQRLHWQLDVVQWVVEVMKG